MFTPWQDVELVHAVQRPLIRPAIERLDDASRRAGSHAGDSILRAICSLKSTDKLDLRAHWHEPDDDPGRTAPIDRSRDDLAFEIKITEARDYTPAADALPDHSAANPKDPDSNRNQRPAGAKSTRKSATNSTTHATGASNTGSMPRQRIENTCPRT
jgi:hypothetical protein